MSRTPHVATLCTGHQNGCISILFYSFLYNTKEWAHYQYLNFQHSKKKELQTCSSSEAKVFSKFLFRKLLMLLPSFLLKSCGGTYMNWLEFYGLKGEPFGSQPLRQPAEFRDGFVLTESTKTDVEPIITSIEESERYLFLIFGERGAGKSTLMHYIIYRLNQKENILTVDISLIPKGYKTEDPGYGVAIDLTNKVAQNTIDAIRDKYNNLYSTNNEFFQNFEKILSESNPNLDKVSNILKNIFKLLIQENIIPLIFIDNLDKMSTETAKIFLKHQYAQSLFEDVFFPFGVRIFLVADQSWLEMLKHPDYSYLGNPTKIKPLNFAEAETLILKKLRRKAIDLEHFEIPFEKQSIIYLTRISDGNPRKIQEKCRISLIKGATSNNKLIDRDFLEIIEKDLGNEFELIKELLIQDPLIERNLAWLLEIRSKFNEIKSFEDSLLNIFNLMSGVTLDSQTIERLRDYELLSLSLEKLDEKPKYVINPILENIFNKIKSKMGVDHFIKWFSRTEADTISIPYAKLPIEELKRVSDGLSDSKKIQTLEALKEFEQFRLYYLEDENRNECINLAYNVARKLIGIVAPEIVTIEDYIKNQEILKNKISKEIIADYNIIYSYFIRDGDLDISTRDIEVVLEKINNISKIILKTLDEFKVKETPFIFSDPVSLGNFINKRLVSPGFLYISPLEEKNKDFLICWLAESGLFGLSFVPDETNDFSKNLEIYSNYYQFIPFEMQDLLKFNAISSDELEKGNKIRIAHFYELATIINRILIQRIKIRFAFVDNNQFILWTATKDGVDEKIQLIEEETLKVPFFTWINYQIQDKSNQDTIIDNIGRQSTPNMNYIHILHLSDIHIKSISEARQYRTQLEADLIKELKVDHLEYLVISGDIADNSTTDDYKAASVMIGGLVKRFGLDSSRLVIVPGNHDLNFDTSRNAYDLISHPKPSNQFPKEKCIDAGEAGILLRNEEKYELRFENFSKFYNEECDKKEYPLNYSEQGILYLNNEDKILFLGLNSCWEIDHYKPHHKRASVNIDAISCSLDQILNNKYDDWLKIAVMHHPVTGPDAMQNIDFLEQLAIHGFQICMHGHIHESIEGFHEYDNRRGINIIGAGTFGAPKTEHATGIPLQYNLLILDPKTRIITVKTRKKEKVNGAWMADARWGDKNEPSSSYTLEMK